jgi:hypothetical protein
MLHQRMLPRTEPSMFQPGTADRRRFEERSHA